MHYKIKELHKIITILANEEGLSEYGQTLLEGYAVGLDNELASNTEIIGSVSVPFPTIEDYKFWYAPNSAKNLDGTLTNEDWVSEEDKRNFDLFKEFMDEWVVHCNER